MTVTYLGYPRYPLNINPVALVGARVRQKVSKTKSCQNKVSQVSRAAVDSVPRPVQQILK